MVSLSKGLHMTVAGTAATTTAMTSTSPSLPRIGLGMAALGRPGYINLDRDSNGVGKADTRSVEHMRRLAEEVMSRNISLSKESKSRCLPWFDCARSYGKSEEFVGDFLRSSSLSPSDVYVSSKWGYEYVADWNVCLEEGMPHEIKDHSVSTFLRQLEETKTRIGEYVNLYQIHSATFESGVLDNEEVHDALHRCRLDHGWKIGLSVSSPAQDEILRRAMSIRVDDNNIPLFDSVQCTYNLLEQKAGPALLEAFSNSMDIVIKEGMANGRLYNHPVLTHMCEAEPALMKNHVTTDQLALGAILAQPFRPRVLSGAVTTEQLESNFRAVEVAELLQQETHLLERLMEQCVMDSDRYWSDRAALAWN